MMMMMVLRHAFSFHGWDEIVKNCSEYIHDSNASIIGSSTRSGNAYLFCRLVR